MPDVIGDKGSGFRIKVDVMTEFNFGPKTPEEQEIWKLEVARVDREIEEYEGTFHCRLNQLKEKLRPISNWFYYQSRSIKFLYQRLTRGWDDSATWSLNTHLAQIIAPRLRRFKELNTHAWPGPVEGMPGTGRFETFEEWQEALSKMIYAFECYGAEDRDFWEFSESERKKIEEGLMLFAKCYGDLWD